VALSKPILAELEAFEDKGVDTCLTCPKLCRWACPVAEAEMRETVSPHSLVVLGGFLKKGIATVESAGDHPFHCTHCGACTEACLHKNDVPMLLSLARGRVLQGHAAPAAVSEVRGRFGVAGNPQGAALDGVLARVTSDADVDLSRGGSTVYFPGCETLSATPEASTAFLRTTLLFGLSGLSVTPMSASCCGLALLWAGDLEGFAAHAERFATQVKDVETLVVHDPACAGALGQRYRQVGVDLAPRIVHVGAYLEARLQPTTQSPDGAARPRIAYHDACNLVRGTGLVDEPRSLIARVGEIVELSLMKGREVDCCGAGGLLPLTAPDVARAMGEAKIHAFVESGADELAMMSPRCAAHLRAIDPTLKIVDVTVLLSRL
jgi:fumarate reductase (CoM/CoB) subunit B